MGRGEGEKRKFDFSSIRVTALLFLFSSYFSSPLGEEGIYRVRLRPLSSGCHRSAGHKAFRASATSLKHPYSRQQYSSCVRLRARTATVHPDLNRNRGRVYECQRLAEARGQRNLTMKESHFAFSVRFFFFSTWRFVPGRHCAKRIACLRMQFPHIEQT